MTFCGAFKRGCCRLQGDSLTQYEKSKREELKLAGITEAEQSRRKGLVLEGICKHMNRTGFSYVLSVDSQAVLDFEHKSGHTIIACHNCTSYSTTTTFEDSEFTWVFIWDRHELFELCGVQDLGRCLCLKCQEYLDRDYRCDISDFIDERELCKTLFGANEMGAYDLPVTGSVA